MNKRTFNTLLLFTGFVVLGIVSLQIIWLFNMSAIRKSELKTNTQQALTNIAGKLERNDNLTMIIDNYRGIIPDSLSMPPLNSDLEVLVNGIDSIENHVGIRSTTMDLSKWEELEAYKNLADVMSKYSEPMNSNQPLVPLLGQLAEIGKLAPKDMFLKDSLIELTNSTTVNVMNVGKTVINSTVVSKINRKAKDIDSLVHQMIF